MRAAPKEYRYLVRKDRGEGAPPSIEDEYSLAELAGRMVVRDERRNRYLLFESSAEGLRWCAEAPESERSFHEVVFDAPQRLKFDIDAPSHKLSHDAAAEIRAIMDRLIEAILDEFYEAYYGHVPAPLGRAGLAVTDSCGATPAGIKYSYHIVVVPHYVANCEEAREFTARVIERLPPAMRPYVDPDVNKRIQNFRLAGSAKLGSGRYKLATQAAAELFGTAAGAMPHELLVRAPVGAPTLPRVYGQGGARVEEAPMSLSDAAVSAVLDLAAREGVTAGHIFSEVRGTLLCFTREAPTHCRLCGETHHHDNSLMLGVDRGAADGAPRQVVELCRQARGRRRVVGEVVVPEGGGLRGAPAGGAPAAKAAAGLAGVIARHIDRLRAGADPHEPNAFERLPAAQCTIYAEPAMRPYGLEGTLAVRAQMSLGKTKELRGLLERHFPAGGLAPSRIVFATFRQTFTAAVKAQFPTFEVYSDVKGLLRSPRLIVQVESLHRLHKGAGPAPVDLLILDEVESILAQFNSGLHRHFGASFAVFQWLLATARHVVCMDANLGDRTYNMLAQLRPAHPPHFHWNRYARAAEDTYHFTADHGAWLGRLYGGLRAGQRVVVPTNSVTEARVLAEAIRREFPAKRVLLYTSETPPSEKALHFGDVHTFWGGDTDAVIFSPTITAGLSHEQAHFDALYGYFTDGSCDVETCRQMLGRVRSLRTREHHICLRATGATLPATTAQISRLVHSSRAALYRDVSSAALWFEYDPAAEGGIRFYESPYYGLWLETQRINNLSRNDFARRFISQVADTGARIEAFSAPDGGEAGGALLLAHGHARTSLHDARCEAVAAAADLSGEEADGVRELLRGQQDVPPPLRFGYEKYQLREWYSWHGRPIDPGFVRDYQKPGTRRVYRNLCLLTEGRTVGESLDLMRRRELAHYEHTMDTRNEGRDLIRHKTAYVFQAHRIAVWALQLCGYACITDPSAVPEDALAEKLCSALPELVRAAPGIAYEFEMAAPKFERVGHDYGCDGDRVRFLGRMLRALNPIFRRMYGLQVRRAPKLATYSLGPNATGKLFSFGVADAGRPHIPSQLESHAGHPLQRIPAFPDDLPAAATPRPLSALGAAYDAHEPFGGDLSPDASYDELDLLGLFGAGAGAAPEAADDLDLLALFGAGAGALHLEDPEAILRSIMCGDGLVIASGVPHVVPG